MLPRSAVERVFEVRPSDRQGLCCGHLGRIRIQDKVKFDRLVAVGLQGPIGNQRLANAENRIGVEVGVTPAKDVRI